MRQRLRTLFQPTDVGRQEVERLIETHGRELDDRADELIERMAELERREERTVQLRTAVERMLRDGAAELDARQTQLNELGAQLAEREAALRRLEDEISERRQKVGAVELHRAAVERRERALEERQRMLEQISTELAERERRVLEGRASEGHEVRDAELSSREASLAASALELERRREQLAALEQATMERAARGDIAQAQLDERAAELARLAEELNERELQLAAQRPPAPVEPDPERAHLLFVGGDRYRLVAGDGPAPAPGSEIALDGAMYRVVGMGASPLPGDPRHCALLEPLLQASEVEIPVE
jgi:DNA repair exonuclease SbcCD ATPase subunit